MTRYVLGLGLLALLGGCASGPKLPDYVEPKLSDAQSATLEGTGGTYITVVDNTSPSGAFIRLQGMGGNTVRLTPGSHRVTIALGGSSYGTQGGASLTKKDTNHTITQKFDAGHKYKVSPDNKWNPFNTSVTVRDETDGNVTKYD